MKVVAVINYKGGVGKTTAVANIGAQLASRGKNVLLIDFDPQISLTLSFYSIFEWEQQLRDKYTLWSWLNAFDTRDKVELADLVLTPPRAEAALSGRGRLDLIASHFDLINEDLRLMGQLLHGNSEVELRTNRVRLQQRLTQALRHPRFADYDVVLIDCPPNFNIATRLALVASGYSITPARADYLSTIGLRYLFANYGRLVDGFNEDVHLVGDPDDEEVIEPLHLGVVFTMVQFNNRQPYNAQQNFMVQVREDFPVFSSMMRYNNSLYGDSGEGGVPVALRDRIHPDVAADLDDLATELLKRLGDDEGIRL